MGGGKQRLAIESQALPHPRGKSPHREAGLAQLSEQAAGIAQPVQKLPIPGLGPGVHQAGGGGVGVLVFHLAGEAVGQVLRHHQKPLGPLQELGLLLFYGHELIDGVELLLLNAGAAVELLERDLLFHQPVHALGTAVPVGHGVPQGVPVSI